MEQVNVQSQRQGEKEGVAAAPLLVVLQLTKDEGELHINCVFCGKYRNSNLYS